MDQLNKLVTNVNCLLFSTSPRSGSAPTSAGKPPTSSGDDWQQCHTYNALNLNQPINNQNDGNDVTDPATDIALCLMKFKEAREEKKNVICLPCGAALFSSLIIVSEIVCRKSASLKKLFVLWRLLKASSRPR